MVNRDQYWQEREGLITPEGVPPVAKDQPPPGFSPFRIVLIFGLLFGLALVFITPPTQVPDEGAHFYRAYQLSDFRLEAQKVDDHIGGEIPESLSTVVNGLAEGLPFHPEAKTSPSKIYQFMLVPLENDKRVFTPFPTSALYSPAAYVPQILAITIGRTLGIPPLLMFYLARIFNLLASVLLMSYAVSTIPIAKWSLLLLGLMPMTLFQMASLSPDALTFAASFAFIALVSRVALRGFGGWDLLNLLGFGLLTMLSKNSYAPLVLFIFAIPPRRFGGWAWYLSSLFIFAIVLFIPWFFWTWSIHDLFEPARTDVMIKPFIQSQVIISEPLRFFKILTSTVSDNLPYYVDTFFGRLGYQDTVLPSLLKAVYIVTLIALIFLEPALPYNWVWEQRLWTLLVAGGTTFVIFVIMYLTRTAVGADVIDGFQGRYFIPIAPLLVMAFVRKAKRFRKYNMAIQRYSLGLIFVTLTTTLVTVVQRYYID
jgi:uncharacterized membrane protein